MIVTCPQCTTRYRIRDDKFKGQKARITCRNCKHQFIVDRNDPATHEPVEPEHAAEPEKPSVQVALQADVGLPVTFRRDGQEQRGDYDDEDDESDVPTMVMSHSPGFVRQIREEAPATAPSAPEGFPAPIAPQAPPAGVPIPPPTVIARPSIRPPPPPKSALQRYKVVLLIVALMFLTMLAVLIFGLIGQS